MTRLAPPARYGPPASLPPGVDWLSYTDAYFAGRRRHDLEAIVAYAAYRRYHESEQQTFDE